MALFHEPRETLPYPVLLACYLIYAREETSDKAEQRASRDAENGQIWIVVRLACVQAIHQAERDVERA